MTFLSWKVNDANFLFPDVIIADLVRSPMNIRVRVGATQNTCVTVSSKSADE